MKTALFMVVFVTVDRKLEHNNLVKLYGVCTKKKPFMIVTEYMKNGLIFFMIIHFSLSLCLFSPVVTAICIA